MISFVTCANFTFWMSKPVSSSTSLIAHDSHDSYLGVGVIDSFNSDSGLNVTFIWLSLTYISRCPPGSANVPCPWEFLRKPANTWIVIGLEWIWTSTCQATTLQKAKYSPCSSNSTHLRWVSWVFYKDPYTYADYNLFRGGHDTACGRPPMLCEESRSSRELFQAKDKQYFLIKVTQYIST